MKAQEIFKRVRGAIGNAVVWGAGWSGAMLAVFGVLFVLGRVHTSDWHDAWQMAARLGVVGGLAGGAFSAVIGILYRGRKLAQISWVRFGIGGGVVAGLFVPTFMVVGRTISGDGPLAMGNYIASALTAAAFGAVVAGVSMKLAQRATPLSSDDGYDSERFDAMDVSDGVIDRQGGEDVAIPHARSTSSIDRTS